METLTSMEEERKRRKRDYAIQLSKLMGKQLVSGMSKGKKEEARERAGLGLRRVSSHK